MFVEFFGSGVSQLSIADRATISNMCPEYGATVGFFPIDEQSITYLQQTGESHIFTPCYVKQVCSSLDVLQLHTATALSRLLYWNGGKNQVDHMIVNSESYLKAICSIKYFF